MPDQLNLDLIPLIERRCESMATTSLRKIEIKFIAVIAICTLLWTLTPDAFAVSGKNKGIKTVTKTAIKSAPKTAGRTSQAPILNTFLNGFRCAKCD